MAEPTEPIKGLIIPNTGDQPGAWGTSSINPDITNIASMLGGFATLSLSAATTVALTNSGASLTPGGNSVQSFNKTLRFTGTQTGTATITFSVQGDYIIDNQCTGTTFPIVLAPASGTGTQIGAPWGRKCTIFFDGTNVDYANPPDPGTAIDLHGMTVVPCWMTVCTKQYALVKDGTVYNVSSYPQLGAQLGATFGGNGATTFGVPDERSRMRLAWDNSGSANRVTSGGSGIAGNTMGASGGDQLTQSHNHTGSGNVSDPGHSHGPEATWDFTSVNNTHIAVGGTTQFGTNTTPPATTGITVPSLNINNTGGGSSQNMPPTIVSFLALIKT